MKISMKFLTWAIGVLGNGGIAAVNPDVTAEDAAIRGTWLTIAYIIARAIQDLAKALAARKEVPVP